MSNFLDLDDTPSREPAPTPSPDLRSLVASVPVSRPRPYLNPQVSDQLAAQHGFASRDHSDRFLGTTGIPSRRTVRGAVAEETKQLSIRMPLSLYTEFLAFADEKKLTYSEAIKALLDSRQK
jgi:hypothetical protein